ncbi:hypothetical protein LguiB_025334 [Lonicera macranthoides]
MELPISTCLSHSVVVSRVFLCPCASKYSFNAYIFRREKLWSRLKCNSKPIREELSVEKGSSQNENRRHEDREDFGNVWEDSEFVEVIGIGSRKDAVLDFCLDSPSRSSALRFWNILANDSSRIQLRQRLLGKDNTPRIVETPIALQSCPKAVILVAGAAYGSYHVMVHDILRTVKSVNGLVIGIILKPFSFEGRKRQREVKDLVDKLEELTNFIITIDTDALLEKDLVTLDEALKTSNNAVLMAMNAISVLVSETYTKHLDVPHDNMKELKVSELKKILGSYKNAKIGFGAGYNIKTSIVRAIYECPFLGIGIKDLNGVVVCILSSSDAIDCSDVHSVLQSFRQTTECNGAVIISKIHEANLEPNLIVTTVITLDYIGEETSQKDGMLSRLAKHFPFIFNFLGKHNLQPQSIEENGSFEDSHPSKVKNSPVSYEMPETVPVDGTAEDFGIYSAELQTLFSSSGDEIYSLRDDGNSSEQLDVEYSEANNSHSSTSYDQTTEGAPFEWEPLNRENIGSAYQITRDWTSEGADNSGATSVLDNLSIYKLPVGVKPSEALKFSSDTSSTGNCPEKIYVADMKAESQLTVNYANASKKQGLLSSRAASMLEAERSSKKKWSPTVAIKYRGGSYLGRCQGGLPEGKGRLSLGDGSIYDGMWRYGKRSGLGTFYFSNGDVFRGSWRDDVMHGKGWFYFRTGDRWFVNFWKGKANGEGRFYSNNGDVFFGRFKDGWRHGHFLCINVEGSRCLEIWDEGVLVSREELDADAAAA